MKNLQLRRSSAIYENLVAAKTALSGLDVSNFADGTPVLARYIDGDVKKSLLGIVYSGETGNHVTIFEGDAVVDGDHIKVYDTTHTSKEEPILNFPYTFSNTYFSGLTVNSGATIAQAFDVVQYNIDQLASAVGRGLKYVTGGTEEAKTYTLYVTDDKGVEIGDGIDASVFIKDGMIDSVAWSKEEGKEHVLVITWNTDAGKEATEIDFKELVDVYDTDNLKVGSGFTTLDGGYNEAFTAVTTADTIVSGETTSSALHKLENVVSKLVDEVIDDELVTEKSIEALANAAGVLEDDEIKYKENSGAAYISNATSLKDADDKLDAAIKNLADNAKSVSGDTCISVSLNGNVQTVKLNHTTATEGAGLKDINDSGTTKLDVDFDFGTW